MKNAKEELLSIVDSKAVMPYILCAYIRLDSSDKTIVLKRGYTDDELAAFMCKLDFEYNHSYGVQEVYGTVWFKDGTWMDRCEYDGSEWWEYRRCPDIVAECR